MAAKFKGKDVIDLDPAPEMIEKMRQRPAGRRLLERLHVGAEMRRRRTLMPQAAPRRSSRTISIPSNVKLYRRVKAPANGVDGG